MSKKMSRREGTGRKDQKEEIPPDPREVIPGKKEREITNREE